MPFSLSALPGIGPKAVQDLAQLGIHTCKDLLFRIPRRYQDFSSIRQIAFITPGESVTLRVTIESVSERRIKGRKLSITEAVVFDESESLKVVWFNGKYAMKNLREGMQVQLSGTVEQTKYGLQMRQPVYERSGTKALHTGRIVPVYALRGSLTPKRLRNAIHTAIKHVGVDEWLPEHIRNQESLIGLQEAITQIHFPDSGESLALAKKRLSFDELFLYELAHLQSSSRLKKLPAPTIPIREELLKDYASGLPFTLTGAQKKAIWAIANDLEKGVPMNRLLEGDVGAGKTVVAAAAMRLASSEGIQSAMLVPTEILAEQHAQSLGKIFNAVDDISVALLTRSFARLNEEDLSRSELEKKIKDGEVQIIVGTHALIQDSTTFHTLGLVIIDEQHRFGVRQRQALQQKQEKDLGVPHLLSMTATPIPRTLALTIYGDLDISILDEMPKGRLPVKTFLVTKEVNKTFDAISLELNKGHQAFFICPLIDESDAIQAKSVHMLQEELSTSVLGKHKIAILHGRMSGDEKESTMRQFANHEIDILISTTVIEVGVDVPNATVMFVEGAERFGLAQLHQLRGRVGRSDKQSYCYLRPSGFVSKQSFERLLCLTRSNNGFELAEMDLKLRGPGDRQGTNQTGFPEFQIANVFDVNLLSKTRDWAKTLIQEDSNLESFPELKNRLDAYTETIHFE